MGYKSTQRSTSSYTQLRDSAMNAVGILGAETTTAGAAPLSAFSSHGMAAAAGHAAGHAAGDYRQERSLAIHEIFQRKMLYCRSGYNLNIWPDGTVNGTAGKYGVLRFYTLAASFAFLWMDTAPDQGRPKIAIKGEASNLWLCMNQAGELFGSAKKTDECEFMEEVLANYYNAYYSAKYPSKTVNGTRRWYVALGHDGRSRLGRTSRWKHRMSQFLPRYVSGGVAAHVNIQAGLPPNMFPSPIKTTLSPSLGKAGRHRDDRGKRPNKLDAGPSTSHKPMTSSFFVSIHGTSRNRTVVSAKPEQTRHLKRKFEPHRRRSQSPPAAIKSLASSLLWA